MTGCHWSLILSYFSVTLPIWINGIESLSQSLLCLLFIREMWVVTSLLQIANLPGYGIWVCYSSLLLKETCLTVRGRGHTLFVFVSPEPTIGCQESIKYLWEMPWFCYPIRRPVLWPRMSQCATEPAFLFSSWDGNVSITSASLGTSGSEGGWGLRTGDTLIRQVRERTCSFKLGRKNLLSKENCTRWN